jgi:hypothetical protein
LIITGRTFFLSFVSLEDIPLYQNASPNPSVRKTLANLHTTELLELAKFLDLAIDTTNTVIQLQAILQPAVNEAVGSGTTHTNFARIFPAPQQDPPKEEEPEDEEDGEENDEAASFCGVQNRTA